MICLFFALQKMYLIMEYCSGGELADAVKTRTFEEEEVKTIIQRLASAIAYLHKKGGHHYQNLAALPIHLGIILKLVFQHSYAKMLILHSTGKLLHAVEQFASLIIGLTKTEPTEPFATAMTINYNNVNQF